MEIFKKVAEAMDASSADVITVINGLGNMLERVARVGAQVDAVRQAEITAWIDELRKKDRLASGDAAVVVSSWIEAAYMNENARSSGLMEAFKAAVGPAITMLLPVLMQKRPEWFNFTGGDAKGPN